ncbi:MAG TPA: histidine kinase [Candidatus Limnocylindrales bacterium]|nr:histidine kinase [Candidatus Limnocylindrales bacterium]
MRIASGLLLVAAAAAGWVGRELRLTLPGWAAAPLAALLLFLLWYAWRTRRRYEGSLRDRARLLNEASEAAVAAAVDGERDRIARELHDIVSHNVSLMVIQAGAARRVVTAIFARAKQRAALSPGEPPIVPDHLANENPCLPNDQIPNGGGDNANAPHDATDALLAVEASGRAAMTELRHLLGLLAPDGTGEDDLLPQPGMSRLDELVDRVAFAGLPVELKVEGDPRPLAPGLDLTAYRVIQEALTNALKHAPGAHASVNVRYTDRYLRLEVLNSGPSILTGSPPKPAVVRSDGRGLLGLRERVAVFGGHLDARRRLGGGFRVRARIPL